MPDQSRTKKGGSPVDAPKTTAKNAGPSTSQLFSPDLDGATFEGFDKYRRPFVGEMSRGDDAKNLPDGALELPKPEGDALAAAIQEVTREYLEEEPRAAKKRADMVASVMRQFDAHSFDGPRDRIYRRSFKDNLRDVLLEYLSDRSGSFYTLKTTDCIPRLVTEALVWKSRRTLGLLWTLAQQGDNGALPQLAEIVVPLVKSINEKALTSPGNLSGIAELLPFWPVLKSEHRDYDDDHAKLLKSLNVGARFPFRIAHETRWTATDPIGRWAIHLCQELEIMQDGWCAETDDDRPWEEKLLGLKSFSSASWPDWWACAQWLLKREYIDVLGIPELNPPPKPSRRRESPGVIRKRIFQALKDKFKSMAGENKF